MNNMRRGFTMIELIFVIVIIGILAAVAIPKLSATRDDAKKVQEEANVRTCLTEIVAEYTALGTTTTATAGEACTGPGVGVTVSGDDVTVAGSTSGKSVTSTYKGSNVSY